MPTRYNYSGAGCRLSVLDNGNVGAPAMVLLHGMRDHAGAMSRIADEFSDYRVLVPDLRGHGHSEHTATYTMMHFIADLRALLAHFQLDRPILVGHSLGGHISWIFSATHPEMPSRLVLIDGLGPPNLAESFPASLLQQNWRSHVDGLLDPASQRRAMANSSEAQRRLMQNNPRLDADWAQALVAEGVEPHPDGGVRWRWDPFAQMVFSTFPGQVAQTLFPLIEAPVQIVTGDQGIEYWARQRPDLLERKADFDAANERRFALFRNARHAEIAGAGHMVNYDQPDELNRIIRRFVEDPDP